MDSNLIALKLVLDGVGQTDAIAGVADDVNKRLRVQKSVYLSQICGADLGYRYNWYVKGPYCPSLAKDYYELADSLEGGEQDVVGMRLNDHILAALDRAKPLLEKPADIQLSHTHWLELVASLDYLRRVSRKSNDDAKTVICAQKPHLRDWIDRGMSHVETFAPAI